MGILLIKKFEAKKMKSNKRKKEKKHLRKLEEHFLILHVHHLCGHLIIWLTMYSLTPPSCSPLPWCCQPPWCTVYTAHTCYQTYQLTWWRGARDTCVSENRIIIFFSIGYRVWRPHANIRLMPDNKSWVPKKFCTQLVQDGQCEEESSAIKFPTATTSSSQNQQWWDEFKTCLHDRETSKFWSVECTDQFFAKIEVVDEGSPDDIGKFAPKLKYLGHWLQ